MIAAHSTSPPNGLFLEERHKAIVQRILLKLVPSVRVWAYGSRASGRNVWRCSDLDLAIDKELSWTTRGLLSEAFDESDLPMNVDVVELPMISEEFAERIRRDFVLVQAGAPTALTAA